MLDLIELFAGSTNFTRRLRRQPQLTCLAAAIALVVLIVIVFALLILGTFIAGLRP